MDWTKCLIRCSFLILFTLCIISSAEDDSDYRLNDDVKPLDYSILIRPYLEHDDPSKVFTFDGYVNIRMKVLNDNVNAITLHKKDLNIYRSQITANFAKTDVTSIVAVAEDEQTDKYTLSLNQQLVKDETYTLTLDFNGRVQEEPHGFYRASYFENNVTK